MPDRRQGSGEASAQEGVGREPLPQSSRQRFWVIEPAAAFEDSRWQDRAIWRVVVAAPTASFAREVAEAWAQPKDVQIGNESDSPVAGFADEKLYLVREVPSDPQWPASGDESKVIDAKLLREAPDIIEI